MEYTDSATEVAEVRLSLPVFDGPLDLLLHLIRKNKIDIYDIPVQAVTEQYMAYLRAAEEFNLSLGTEFFELAATLLAIKARLLLPKPAAPEEDVDPREELVVRLQEWEAVKELQRRISEGLAAGEDYLEKKPTVLPSARLRTDVQWARLARVWERLQEEKPQDEVRVVVKEDISPVLLRARFRAALRQGPVYLTEYLGALTTRLQRITVFLDVLELVRIGTATVAEDAHGIYVGEK